MEVVKQPFTNAQLELLKAFSSNLSEPELNELKKVLAEFLARRATREADRVRDTKGWKEADDAHLLQRKMGVEDPMQKEVPASEAFPKRDTAREGTVAEDLSDPQDYFLPHSLLSPEDEKNVQRIWKSPGGC